MIIVQIRIIEFFDEIITFKKYLVLKWFNMYLKTYKLKI